MTDIATLRERYKAAADELTAAEDRYMALAAELTIALEKDCGERPQIRDGFPGTTEDYLLSPI